MKTIDDLPVSDKRVLVRADLNVPLDGGRVADDTRIAASLPTLTELAARGAKVIVCAHLGRPGGQPDQRYSLAPVAVRLGELLGHPVPLAADTAGLSAQAAIAAMRPGDFLLLQNLRFNQEETSKDDAVRGSFAGRLAALADLYVGDGFGSMHRKHASVYDVALLLPHAAGRLVQAEVAALSRLTGQIRRPYVVMLGGAKVTDKFGAIDHLLAIADEILVGGAMVFPFLVAEGHKVGTSLLDTGQVTAAGDYLSRPGGKIVLPPDLIVAAGPGAPAAGAPPELVAAGAIPADRMALDIGPAAARSFAAALHTAGTVFWNGPMGRFEVPAYAGGTWAVARALAQGSAFTVIGGGDTTAAVHELGFPDNAFGYISTGGGASLEFVEGNTLPGLAALEDG